MFVSEIQLRGHKHGEHAPHIVAHAPACDHQVLVDGAVLDDGDAPRGRGMSEQEQFDDL